MNNYEQIIDNIKSVDDLNLGLRTPLNKIPVLGDILF